ncbi:MAG: LCP family protein [Actinomycetota bacterium]|nr:LCP family protein [Actinomycetota bacterium]
MATPQLEGDLKKLHVQSRQDRKKKRGRKWMIIVASILGALVLGMAGGYMWLLSLQNKMQLKPKDAEKINKVVAAPQGDGINIVLAGTDRRANWTSSRADSLMFIHADKKTKKIYMLSIPRDTRVMIPGRGMDKINHSWAFGGAPLLIRTVSDFVNQPVNYYFQVDYGRFEEAVNAMGGVDFATDLSFYDGELGVAVRPGLRHREGKEALAIVRNRHVGSGGGGDLARVPVQQQFIQAMMAQSIKSYADVPRMANVVASYVNTNMGLTEMLATGRAFADSSRQIDMAILPGKGVMINRISYVIPDLGAKDTLLSAMLSNKPFPR